jgi:hypothetical protein
MATLLIDIPLCAANLRAARMLDFMLVTIEESWERQDVYHTVNQPTTTNGYTALHWWVGPKRCTCHKCNHGACSMCQPLETGCAHLQLASWQPTRMTTPDFFFGLAGSYPVRA